MHSSSSRLQKWFCEASLFFHKGRGEGTALRLQGKGRGNLSWKGLKGSKMSKTISVVFILVWDRCLGNFQSRNNM